MSDYYIEKVNEMDANIKPYAYIVLMSPQSVLPIPSYQQVIMLNKNKEVYAMKISELGILKTPIKINHFTLEKKNKKSVFFDCSQISAKGNYDVVKELLSDDFTSVDSFITFVNNR